MTIPLGVLAVGAIFAGMVFYKPFFGSDASVGKFFGAIEAKAEDTEHATATFLLGSPAYAAEDAKEKEAKKGAEWPETPGKGAIFKHPDNEVLEKAHYVPTWVKLSPFVAMLLGFFTAWMMYIRHPDWPAKLAAQQRILYEFLLNKWYIDELYDVVFVRPAKWLGHFLWKRGDGNTIDGFLNGMAMGVVPFFTRLAGRWQSGYLFTYAFAMVIGIAILITIVTLGGGAN
jgi:NADH-quinone oxidoreductase subunit L